ncbi:MAG: hypothetical protein FWD55_08970 [Propionibacteriaceae bacterium]|nr:hypothetical protein [Propionibacteriaceae bacterium]
MKHSEFRIGLTFRCGTGVWIGVWRCTDIGTNAITAERTDHLDGEHVFSEDEMVDCSPTKLQLPPGFRDVTAQHVGEVITFVGPMMTTYKPKPKEEPKSSPVPIGTDEEMLANILKAHPTLTREEALEHLKVYGWDLTESDKKGSE